MKHLQIKHLWLQDWVAERTVSLGKIDTKLNTSDLLTKYLAAPRFAYLRDMMVGDGVCDVHGG